MNVDHLHSDELEYELGIRGYPAGGTVAEKRKQLRTALKLEKDGVTFSMVPILAPEEDINVCDQKTAELKEATDRFDYTNAVNEQKRLRSRLVHVMGRINRISDKNLSLQKGQLLVKCGEISDFLEESVLLLEPVQIPNMPTVVPSPHSSDTASAGKTLSNQGPIKGNQSLQEHNTSLLDVTPEDLQSAINQLELNSSAQAATTPVTQTIVTTSAGVNTVTSSAYHPGLYQPHYVPAQQQFGLPPQVAYSGFMPPFNHIPPSQQQPTQYPSVPLYGTWPGCLQQVPNVATLGQRVNLPEPHSIYGVPPQNHNAGVVQREDQARVFKTVSQWGIRYDGLSGVTNFLEGVEEMRLACGFSKNQLASVAVVLFQGVALDWFRANVKPSFSWDNLVERLRAAFLSGEYEEDLWADIRLRTQGQWERTAMFIAVMQNLFKKLADQPMERTQIRIIRRNLLPYIQSQLAMRDFTTIEELTAACQRVEEAQVRIERFKPPPTNPNLVAERELMYNPRKQSHTIHSVQPVPGMTDGVERDVESQRLVSSPMPATCNPRIICWNCRRGGHIKSDCPNPPAKHCFGCGKPGVTRHTCPQCSGNARPAH